MKFNNDEPSGAKSAVLENLVGLPLFFPLLGWSVLFCKKKLHFHKTKCF